MKITPKIFSIPPYLSTTWAHVRTLYLKDGSLIVNLIDGAVITIPNLPEEAIKEIFHAHTSYLENLQQRPPIPPQTPFHLFQAGPQSPNPQGNTAGALHFSFDNMETLNSALQHNPAQAHMPDLPGEIVGKIASIARIVAPNEIQNMPKPEPHCNCPHCQIARAIHGKEERPVATEAAGVADPIEEEISDTDLSFEQWSIEQSGENLFRVTNKLDTQEKYNVYLGNPVGCTCGHQGCEHILAVLKS